MPRAGARLGRASGTLWSRADRKSHNSGTEICDQNQDQCTTGEDPLDNSRRQEKDHHYERHYAVNDGQPDTPDAKAQQTDRADRAKSPEDSADDHELIEVVLEERNDELETIARVVLTDAKDREHHEGNEDPPPPVGQEQWRSRQMAVPPLGAEPSEHRDHDAERPGPQKNFR